jgi:hypothetical protein
MISQRSLDNRWTKLLLGERLFHEYFRLQQCPKSAATDAKLRKLEQQFTACYGSSISLRSLYTAAWPLLEVSSKEQAARMKAAIMALDPAAIAND